ncbi:MAG: Txe/YoeB family addiction module toxin [Sphingobacteriales bacterium]|nr:MAG: Txe/YoeB family addiction module toxin [Sphingobacteriales bacterium]
MEIIYSPKAKDDINYWKKQGNKAIQTKITNLLQAVLESPYQGIGKPEPLKHKLQGFYSRRINQEHRLIYKIENNVIRIESLKGHYIKV